MLHSFGIEVLVQPALYAAAAITVLVLLLKGSSRPTKDIDGVTVKGRRQLAPGARKRALLALLAAFIILPALVITPPGHRAAIYNLGGGVSSNERSEGLSFVLPWIQSARQVSVRTQVYEVELYPQTKDLQEVTVPVAVNYHVEPEMAAELYQAVGLNYQTTVIAPAISQLLTQEVGQFFAVDFAENRAALASAVGTALQGRLDHYGIIVESVNVRDAIFDPAFITAVKEKVIADQEAAEQERLVAAEKHKKDQVIQQAQAESGRRRITAEGEAQAIKDVASALGFTPAEYLEWVRLGKWDGALPRTVVGSDTADLIFDVGGTPSE
jgi:prohibitin 2